MGASGVGNGVSVSMSGVDTVIHTPLPPIASCATCVGLVKLCSKFYP